MITWAGAEYRKSAEAKSMRQENGSKEKMLIIKKKLEVEFRFKKIPWIEFEVFHIKLAVARSVLA